MSWFVYMLQCKGNRIYTGIAKDVQKRLEEHRSGKGAKFTKAFEPQKLLKTFEVASHGDALKMEYAIKQMDRAQKIQLARKLH